MTNNNCYWHSDRYAGVTCQRCERRVCTECMHTASVGFHCPACIKPQNIHSRRKQRSSVRFGGRIENVSEQSLTTRSLIAVNLLAFLTTLLKGGSIASGGGDMTIDFGLVGYGRVLSAFSIDYVGIAEGEWWRMFTGSFLHAGVIHLASVSYTHLTLPTILLV